MSTEKKSKNEKNCSFHFFNESEILSIRRELLQWYKTHQRTLPWRTIAKEEKNSNVRAYSVWVSEVMLQQTRVTTVLDYFSIWMSKWKNTKELSRATLDEVNQIWSGLGYYSRARRLYEGAIKIEDEMKGIIPHKWTDLMASLPGVGKYTSRAISSIAFGEPVGVVDGNVIRVLSRLKCIGNDVKASFVVEAFWSNADTLVDPQHPGDFNQGLMELGATVCTPQNPKCESCPLSKHCLAWKESKCKVKGVKDIEDCNLCLPLKYNEVLGVANYPNKGKETKVRTSESVVVILKDSQNNYPMFKRPKKGLLSNLLEFITLEPHVKSNRESILLALNTLLNIQVHNLKFKKNVQHIFSHIRQLYIVWTADIENSNRISEEKVIQNNYQKMEILPYNAIASSHISTAMKKVLQVVQTTNEKKSRKQKQIIDFFTP